MKYRNTKTGAVIDVRTEIVGEYWEKLEEGKKPSSGPGRKARGKKNG